MYHFTTFFDKNYLSRGLVLYNSLKENISDFQLFVLCLDQYTFDFFKEKALTYPEVVCLTLGEIESEDVELKRCKNDRSRIEYYFTISPCLPLYLLTKYNLRHICSLDADILFLDSPVPLFENLNTASVIVTPHKFTEELKDKEKYGVFNVSFQIFKNDSIGISCLRMWREQCIKWCGDYIDDKTNFFADQKYLDYWPQLYNDNLKILDDAVSGLAPWNINNYNLTYRDGYFLSEGQRIIFYHFHGFKFFSKKWATKSFKSYFVKNTIVLQKLYSLYWEKVSENDRKLNLNQFKSVRGNDSSKKIDKILNSDGVCYRFSSSTMFEMNFINVPWLIKGVIRKIYGLFDQS